MSCETCSKPMERKDNDKKEKSFVMSIIISILLISYCLAVILCWKVFWFPKDIESLRWKYSMPSEFGLQTFVIICSLFVVIIGSVITIVLAHFKISWGMFSTGIIGVTSGVMQLVYLINIQTYIDKYDSSLILEKNSTDFLDILKIIVIISFFVIIILSVGLLICEIVHNKEKTYVMLLIAVYILCVAIGIKSAQIVNNMINDNSSIENVDNSQNEE